MTDTPAARLATRAVISQSTTKTSVTSGNQTTITEVTTIDRDGGSMITDVQVLPFMRQLSIDFGAFKIRSDRQHHFYFDDKEISHFIQRPNIVKLDTAALNTFPSFVGTGSLQDLAIVGGLGKILIAERGINDSNVTLYIAHVRGALTNVVAGNATFVNVTTGISSPVTTTVARGNVVSYQHYSGIVGSSSNTNYIYLQADADATTHNSYVGNVLTIVSGTAAGQSSNIVTYNAMTRLAVVSPAFSVMSANSIYSIGDSQSKFSSNVRQAHWSTPRGMIAGTFHLPDPKANSFYSFRTGDRVFRILDNPRNDLSDYTSRADYRFTSNGLDLSLAQLIDRTVIVNTTIISTNTVIGQPPTIFFWSTNTDPIAQSFYVDDFDYPEGLFVSSVDLFFKNKGDWSQVEVQLRPMVEGAPSASEVLPYASKTLLAQDINISDLPNVSNSLTKTKFSFPSPVYLNSKREYAIVVITDDYDVDIFCSELGETILGTNRVVSRQPFLGSMFKSQNGRTFTPLQDEDLMFVINKCNFVSAGTAQFNEEKKPIGQQLPHGATSATYSANAPYDLFTVHSDAAELAGTKLTYAYRATANDDFSLDASYSTFKPDVTQILDERKVVFGPGAATKSFYMQVGLSTLNPDVSPIIFYKRQNLVPQKMLINNMEIHNNIVTVVQTGSSYANANTTLTFTGGSGSGATGRVETNATGHIHRVVMTSIGSGYFDNVTVGISSVSGSGAIINVSSEVDRSGGPAIARYISKTVVLTDGLDAGDLRVYLTAAKPQAAEIAVYYKVRNALDGETIDEKNWVRMRQHGNEFVYSNPTTLNPVEYEYRPSANANNIVYTSATGTYRTFNEYKVKIVLASASTLAPDIPALSDVRAIAFPADAF